MLRLELLSADDLFGLLFASEKGGEHLVMLYRAYIDDSADGKAERVVVAGAIIGDKARWDLLNRRWSERLKDNELEFFKSSHCDNLNGQFHKFRSHGVQRDYD